MAVEEGPGALASGTALDHFAESEELLSLVSTLPEVYSELRSRERSEERFTSETKPLFLVLAYHASMSRYSGQISGAAASTGPLYGYVRS